MNIAFIPASEEDCEQLTQVAKIAKQHWGYTDEWMQLWEEDLTITPAKFANQTIVKGEVDGVLAGFYALAYEEGLVELDGLWILSEYHGKRIGKTLFHHAVHQAKKEGYSSLQLYADPYAEGFYQKLGGQIIGQIPTKIKDRYLHIFQFQLEEIEEVK